MQLPLEKIPEHIRQYFKPGKTQSCGSCYLCHLRTVFTEVSRVLRPSLKEIP